MKIKQYSNKVRKRIVKKNPVFKYGLILSIVIVLAVAFVELAPGDSDSSSLAPNPDYTIYLDSPESVYGVTWDSDEGTLTFDTDANGGLVYEITQNDTAKHDINIIFLNNVDTIVLVGGINITGNMELQGDASVTMLLVYSNTIDGSILVPSGTAIVIDKADSNGALKITAPSSSYAAGIGGGGSAAGVGIDGGTITINGGTVTATGGNNGAGIGGGGSSTGNCGNGGTITINGGTVTAKGRFYGAGIGGGGCNNNNPGSGGSGGTITINGGTVTATGGGAGIGGGQGAMGGNGGTITISGDATVTAVGGGSCAGIGGGYGNKKGGSNGGDITISGNATVTAKAGSYAAGIGGAMCISGNCGNGGNVTIIENATVTAVGGDWGGASDTYGFGGAGIGGGNSIFASDGAGAVLMIEQTAHVRAVSAGRMPAIHVASISGDGFFVDATFGGTISKTKNVEIHVYASDGTVLLDTFTLPANYWNFAYNTGTQISDNLYVYLTPDDIKTITIKGGVYDGSEDIPSADDASMLPVKLGEPTYYTISLDQGMTNGTIEWSTDGVKWYDFPNNGSESSMSFIEIVATVHLRAAGSSGYEFSYWTGGISTETNNPCEYSARTDVTVGAVFSSVGGGGSNNVPNDKLYYITATADSGSSVSPNGVVTVLGGADKEFHFYAKEGYYISSVKVNGVSLTQTQIDLGYYTFFNVYSNKAIDIKSAPTGTISNNPDGSPDVEEPLSDDNSTNAQKDHGLPLFALALVVLLILVGLLMWFLFFYRRYYDVIKTGNSLAIIGRDSVHRKSEYRFTIGNGSSGTVSYRIGEDGTWVTILPDANGEYVVPRGKITDDVTIELH